MSGVTMSLQPLQPDDLDLVLAWRNQPHVRANSRCDAVITPEEHRRWFASIESDARRAAYRVDQNNRPVGICHYQGLQTPATALSYYLGADHVWPGTGVLLQWLAVEQAFQRLGVRCLAAEVLEHNQAPQRLHRLFAFEQAEPGEHAVLRFRLTRDRWLARRETVWNALPAPTRAATSRCQLWPPTSHR
jgi:UDP-4-amino-4,6-dideoxy-N-acetyl-beta-L-altrosamine N-acetyltransferase